MNYLAHIYLSGDDEKILIGNFIADHIKGSAIQLLPKAIKQGVTLHRAIDNFTDTHDIVLQSKKRLYNDFKKYSPVIVDVFYDHFLAKNWNEFHEENLIDYTEKIYSTIKKYNEIIPERTNKMLHYMQRDNWLHSYSTISGIHQALSGMSRRTPFISNMENAAAELEKNYSLYENEFRLFFPELETFVKNFK